jgi:hypothetical protein
MVGHSQSLKLLTPIARANIYPEFEQALQQSEGQADDPKKIEKSPIITGQVWGNDRRVTEFELRVEQANKNQESLPDQIDKADPEGEGKKFGEQLRQTKGGQIVLLGANHTETYPWIALAGVIEGLGKDPRPIILVTENDNSPGYADGSKEWNNTPLEERAVGHLGDRLIRAEHYKSVEDMYKSLFKTIFNNSCHYNYEMITHILETPALNQISQLRPDVILFPVDSNNAAADPVTGMHDDEAANRDTIIAMNLANLHEDKRDKYKDAIIIGLFGGDHVVERQNDNPSKKMNITNYGTNLNYPMAKQLSLLYGDDKVHTIRVAAYGEALNTNSEGKNIYTDFHQFDQIIRIHTFPLYDPWIDPWSGKDLMPKLEDEKKIITH